MKKVSPNKNDVHTPNGFSFFSLFLVLAVAHFGWSVSRMLQPEFTVLENLFLLGSKVTELLSTPFYFTVDPHKMPEVRKRTAAAMDRLIFYERQPVGAKVTYNFHAYSSEPFRLVDRPTHQNASIYLEYEDIYLHRKLSSPSHTASVMYTEEYKDRHLTPPHPSHDANNRNNSSLYFNYVPPVPALVFPFVNITFYLSEISLGNLHTVKYMYDKLTDAERIQNTHKGEIADIITEFKSKRLIRMDHETLLRKEDAQASSNNNNNNNNMHDTEYIYEEGKADKSLKSIFLYVHGGGLTVMDHRSYDKLLRRHANLTAKGAVLIALDYRLAPEFRYPSALEDCIYTLNWLHKYGRNFGLDPTRIIIAGDSGGGNLVAATVSVGLSSPRRYPWAANVKSVGLIYPSLCRGCATVSSIVHGDIFQVNLKASQWFDLQYDKAVGNYPNWHQSPYFAPEEILKKFPPTYLVLFTHDIAFDAGILYHEKLRRLGVSTGLFTAPGVHGFYGCDLWSKYGVESVEWMSARLNEHV